MKRTVVLVVLDGWGLGQNNESNPIYVVGPEHLTWLEKNFPVTSLQASGISVGLPWGEVGNSEVGHLTLGAGKVIYQYFPKISMAIQDESFFGNEVLKNAFAHAKKNNSAVNFVGLLTKATTHAALAHLLALIRMAEQENVPMIKLHLFADGKDSPPKSLEELLLKVPQSKIGTLVGRYYAMNRSGSWQLTQKAYDCLTGTGGQVVEKPDEVIHEVYKKNLNEEFLPPLRLGNGENAIKDNESVVFFNFREDSIRQLSEAFIVPGFKNFPVKKFQNLHIATFTRYRDDFDVPVAFPADTVEKCLGGVLAENGRNQLRLAETYKYAHVTYFFNGHREEPFGNEYRVLIPSLTITHSDERPELMAPALTDRLLEAVQNQAFDFVLVNYANPDTIGHTGNFQACLEAVRIIDREIGRILKVVLDTPVILIITADHGNIEEVISPTTGHIETQHDPSPVPFYLVAQEYRNRKFFNAGNLLNETTGILSDVAPTILELMEIKKPPEMTGNSLLKNLLP